MESRLCSPEAIRFYVLEQLLLRQLKQPRDILRHHVVSKLGVVGKRVDAAVADCPHITRYYKGHTVRYRLRGI
jgi:hypothetical protein